MTILKFQNFFTISLLQKQLHYSPFMLRKHKILRGEVSVSGSKNASLPIIASTILNGGTTKLYNIPDIRDTRITLEILKYLGCKVKKSHGKIEINT